MPYLKNIYVKIFFEIKNNKKEIDTRHEKHIFVSCNLETFISLNLTIQLRILGVA